MQLAFEVLPARKFHGGEISSGKRKEARPTVTRRPMHLVLRSSRANGALSLRRKEREIRELVTVFAKKFHVQIYSSSNNGNHLHLVIQAKDRVGFKKFLMSISGRIAQVITRARKGQKLDGKFWDYVPFTRIVEWGKDFQGVMKYVLQNILESTGVIPYQTRTGERRFENPT